MFSGLMVICIFYVITIFFCLFYYKNSFMFFLVISEFISLILFFIFASFNVFFNYSFDSLSVFLSIIVIEGGVGLCVLIYTIYKGGDDSMLGNSMFL